MSSLTFKERNSLERLFGMASGYVLNFTNSSFGVFVGEKTDLNIHSEKYCSNGGSKANKLREFWTVESDATVGRLLQGLIEHGLTSNLFDLSKDQPLIDECRNLALRLLSGGPNLQILEDYSKTLSAPHLAEQIRRIEASIGNDPSLAIGTAKELVETTCKTILAARGKPVAGTPDMSSLTKDTLRELKLVPEGISEGAKGAEIIKRLLHNLGSIGNSLTELRGLYGTGHGRHGATTGLKPRHAKLAVGAAAALAVFLFETHEDLKSR